MAQAKRDDNYITTLLGVSNADGITPVTLWADPITHRLLVSSGFSNPMTTGGDIIYGGASGVATRLGNGTAGQVLQSNGTTLAPSWETQSGGGNAQTADPLSQFAATTSLQLLGVISDETGSGALVFGTSPTLITPALGTPSALVGTNITGTASGLTAGNVTTNANLTGHITSTGNATVLGSFTSLQLLTALTDETGSGANVFATSPTLVTPILGTPTSATLTNATGLPISGLVNSTSLALGVGSIDLGHATDTTVSRSGAGVIAVEGVVIPSISSTNTLTNKRITKRSSTAASTATLTPAKADFDVYTLTAQAAALTIANPTGTPVIGDTIAIYVTDNTTARGITFGTYFKGFGAALPTTTTISKTLLITAQYYGTNLWSVLSAEQV